MPAFFSAASGGEGGQFSLLILFIPLALLAYLMFSQRRRAKREATAQQGLQIGDAVATRAGILGAVEGLDGPRVRVLVAPGVVLTFDRRAVIPAPGPMAGNSDGERDETDSEGTRPDGTDPDDGDPGHTRGDTN